MEVFSDFEGFDAWMAYHGQHIGDALQTCTAAVETMLSRGFKEPLTADAIHPDEIGATSSLREGMTFRGISSRQRAVMRDIEIICEENQLHSPRIFAAEAVTPFARRLAGLFPRFLGSEYTTDPEKLDWLYPIPREDLCGLSLKSDMFDVIVTNEVLEHVPSIDAALAEIYRVLRPGGWHVGTLPFYYLSEKSERRAILRNGEVVHLLEPEYHGDPMNNKGGALVFEIPGWDILERAKAAGFSRAFMRHRISATYGVVCENIGGVFTFCCQK